jgi:hypothetical protein
VQLYSTETYQVETAVLRAIVTKGDDEDNIAFRIGASREGSEKA